MKTLALFYPGCIEFEVMLACEILNSKFPVDIITPDGADHFGSNGMTFRASGSIKSADPSTYKIALVPGGDPSILIGNDELSQLLPSLHVHGAIIGAICRGTGIA